MCPQHVNMDKNWIHGGFQNRYQFIKPLLLILTPGWFDNRFKRIDHGLDIENVKQTFRNTLQHRVYKISGISPTHNPTRFYNKTVGSRALISDVEASLHVQSKSISKIRNGQINRVVTKSFENAGQVLI